MIIAVKAFWDGLPKELRQALALIGVIILGMILGKAWLAVRDEGIRRKEREKAEAKTIQVVTKIQQEARHDADAAIQARDTASRYSNAAGVPLEQAGRIFSN